MRPSGRGKTNPPPTPGRAPTSATRDSRQEPPRKPETSNAPPRTNSQKQKAEAAFGTRKSGYVPNSPGLGDEPCVPSKNYFTTRVHTNIFEQSSAGESEASSRNGASRPEPATFIPDPLAKFRDSYMEPRQSSPYHTTGGEKIRVDTGIGLGRTTSTRTPPRKPEMPGTFPRPRSSSTASINVNIGSYNDETSDASPTPVNSGKGKAPYTKTTNGNGPFQPPPSNDFRPMFSAQNAPKPGNTGNPPTTASKRKPILPLRISAVLTKALQLQRMHNLPKPMGTPQCMAPRCVHPLRFLNSLSLLCKTSQIMPKDMPRSPPVGRSFLLRIKP